MASALRSSVSDTIQQVALRHMDPEHSRDYLFYIDEQILPEGTWLGPRHAGVSLAEKSVLVFVDENPRAGFAHDCRYLLFNPESAQFQEHRARFPPYLDVWPETYRRFGPRESIRPERRRPGEALTPGSIPIGAPHGALNPPATPVALPISQSGRRLAILLAGTPDPATLNTMEFAYRTLLRLQYDPAHIRIANHLGHSTPMCAKWLTLGITPDWEGEDGQPFTMKVTHPGSRFGFCSALADLNPQLEDSLFVHTGGHGDNDESGSYLLTTMESYYSSEFKDDLEKVKVSELVVVMQQCFSGGFRHDVLGCSTAPHIAFASAAAWDTEAYNDQNNDEDYAWNSFARDWFGAQNGGYYRNGPLSANPDAPPSGNGDAHIDAVEAFRYARLTPYKHPKDRPQQGYRLQTVLASKRLRLDGSHFTT